MTSQPETNVTFYHYKLIQKIMYRKELIFFHIFIMLFALIIQTLVFGWLSLFYSVLAFLLMLWLHFVIIRSILFIASEPIRKRWRFRFGLPWLGFVPDQFVPLRILVRTHQHLTWLGLCLFAIMSPWSPISFIYSLVFWHLWLLVPRFICFIRLRKRPNTGVVKLTPNEMLYYQQ